MMVRYTADKSALTTDSRMVVRLDSWMGDKMVVATAAVKVGLSAAWKDV